MTFEAFRGNRTFILFSQYGLMVAVNISLNRINNTYWQTLPFGRGNMTTIPDRGIFKLNQHIIETGEDTLIGLIFARLNFAKFLT